MNRRSRRNKRERRERWEEAKMECEAKWDKRDDRKHKIRNRVKKRGPKE